MNAAQTEITRRSRAIEAATTALLAGDRDLALGVIADELGDDAVPDVLIACDLAAYVNVRWARALGIDPKRAWQEMLLDLDEWHER